MRDIEFMQGMGDILLEQELQGLGYDTAGMGAYEMEQMGELAGILKKVKKVTKKVGKLVKKNILPIAAIAGAAFTGGASAALLAVGKQAAMKGATHVVKKKLSKKAKKRAAKSQAAADAQAANDAAAQVAQSVTTPSAPTLLEAQNAASQAVQSGALPISPVGVAPTQATAAVMTDQLAQRGIDMTSPAGQSLMYRAANEGIQSTPAGEASDAEAGSGPIMAGAGAGFDLKKWWPALALGAGVIFLPKLMGGRRPAR
jgi:hypothetical protein